MPSYKKIGVSLCRQMFYLSTGTLTSVIEDLKEMHKNLTEDSSITDSPKEDLKELKCLLDIFKNHFLEVRLFEPSLFPDEDENNAT